MVFGWGQDPDPDPDRAREAQDRFQHGLSLLHDGHHHDALQALEDAANHGAHAHTPDGYTTQAKALIETGRALRSSDPQAAQDAYSNARDAGLQTDTDEGFLLAIEASLRLGDLHAAHDQHAAAVQVYQGALDTARKLSTDTARELGAHAALRLARIRTEQDDAQASIDASREAIEMAQSANTAQGDRLAALASIDAGRMLRTQARFAEATDAIERALALTAALPEEEALWVETLAYAHEGRVHQQEGRRAAAKNALRSALDTAQGASSSQAALTASNAAWLLAELHAQRGDDEDAREAYDQALEHARQADPPHREEQAARIYLARAHVRLLRAREDDAKAALSKAAELGDEAGTPAGQNAARTARAKNVKLASDDTAPLEDPPRPRLGPPELPDLPREQPQPDEAQAAATPDHETRFPTQVDAASHAQEEPSTDPEPAPEPEPEPASTEPSAQPEAPSPEPEQPGDAPAMTSPSDEQDDATPEQPTTPPSPSPTQEARPSGGQTRPELVDRAETLRELALSRKDEDRLQEALDAVNQALETAPRDADLLHRQASLKATLATWQDDEEGLQEALGTFERAFDEHGGRVDPTTHRPGPNFFFDWGTATYQLARHRDDEGLYEDALERLSTGFEMTPRGARHRIAAARMARCRFGLARTRGDQEAYEHVVQDYEDLEEEAAYALDGEDYATWAKALAWLAEETGDLDAAQEAYRRMRRAYEAE